MQNLLILFHLISCYIIIGRFFGPNFFLYDYRFIMTVDTIVRQVDFMTSWFIRIHLIILNNYWMRFLWYGELPFKVDVSVNIYRDLDNSAYHKKRIQSLFYYTFLWKLNEPNIRNLYVWSLLEFYFVFLVLMDAAWWMLLILVFMYCRSYYLYQKMTSSCDVITFSFGSRKSSFIAVKLLTMIIRIKKIFVLKRSSYNLDYRIALVINRKFIENEDTNLFLLLVGTSNRYTERLNAMDCFFLQVHPCQE